jgi:hypothetical protein
MIESNIPGTTPSPTRFSSAALRNRIRVELNAPARDVWALVGNLERYPEFSAGIERVAVTADSSGRCTDYVCHFRPQEPGGPSMSHREVMRWYEPERGYASVAAEPNEFGLRNCLTMVTLEPSSAGTTSAGTTLTWTEHFDSADLPMQKAVFEEALADIAARLVARFGGRVIDRFVEEAE